LLSFVVVVFSLVACSCGCCKRMFL